MADEQEPLADEMPRVTTRALLVHVVGCLEEIRAEQRAHREAFESHQRETRRNRWIGVAAAILEWRATLLAGGISLAWLKWPWRR